MAQSVKLAEYLFARLHQLGVRSIFGVPGDYNLSLLDYVEPAGLHWIGNCNELNAGYAADGYARIKGLSALITTFGVGELSAINAIAGAYAEKAPIVHIVGTPSRTLQDSRALVHHTLNDGDYRPFSKMHAHVTTAQVNLRDPRTSPAEVDWVLEQCLLHSRPVYIEIPADMVDIKVPSVKLQSTVSIPLSGEPANTEAALSRVLDRMYTCKRPMIFVDGESRAFDILGEINELIKGTQWPTWTTSFGKGLVDETLPNVYGIYTGTYSTKEIRDYIDSADLVLSFGPHHSSTNSYRFSTVPKPAVAVTFTATGVQVQSDTFQDLPAKYFITKLLERLEHSRIPSVAQNPRLDASNVGAESPSELPNSEPVTQRHFWRQVSSMLLPGDIILGETGTAGYGVREFSLPRHCRFFAPVTWLSIGYMLPAAFGASIAQRDMVAENTYHGLHEGRTVLFIGDGSLQMTVQAISDIIREKLNVVIFVINNDGYTIERCIHGRDQKYNDIAPWRYLLAPVFFGAEEEGEHYVRTFRVSTWGGLELVLEDQGMKSGKGLRIVEVIMDRMDAQPPLLALLEAQKERERAVNGSA